MWAGAVVSANLILMAGIAVSLGALFYLVYYYGWTGRRHFADPIGAGWYFGVPITILAVLFASLRLKPSYKIATAVSGFALGMAVYGVELYLNILQHARFGADKALLALDGESKEVKREAARIAKQFGVDVDTRDRLQVIEDFAKQGIEAVPPIRLPIFVNGTEIMPLGGISDKMTVVCNQNGEYLTFRSDEHGFHNAKGVWQSINLKAVAVGNSFTMGYCVPSDKNYVALMNERYPGILNLAMAGEGPLSILAVLKEYLEPLQPKRVLWFYFEGNNLAELQDEKRSPILMRYLKEDFRQGLAGRQNDIDDALMNYVKTQRAKGSGGMRGRSYDFLDRTRDVVKLNELRKQFGLVHGTSKVEMAITSTATLNLFREILAQAKQRVVGWGGKLYFIYLPNWERFAQGDPGIGGRQRAQVLGFVNALGLPLIDLLPAFESQDRPLSLFPFRRPGHYNEKGHRLVADEVLKAMSQGGHIRESAGSEARVG